MRYLFIRDVCSAESCVDCFKAFVTGEDAIFAAMDSVVPNHEIPENVYVCLSFGWIKVNKEKA